MAALTKAGFETARTKGSHHFLRHAGWADNRGPELRQIAGETLGPGLMSKILRDCELTPEEFSRLL